MRVFITGIGGFIGFHVACALKRRGHSVTGCDHFNHYYSPELKKKRASLLEEEGIEVIELDVCDRGAFEKEVELFAPTHLLHLAAQAGVRYSLKSPESYIQANVSGFLSVLEVIRKYPH